MYISYQGFIYLIEKEGDCYNIYDDVGNYLLSVSNNDKELVQKSLQEYYKNK